MFIYLAVGAIVAVVGGILLAACSKRAIGVVYGTLDKVGRITNILLIPVYVCLAPLYLGLGLFSFPEHDGLLGLLGWIICFINASASLFCGFGLGFSVLLRKKGRSKLSFAVQFAGFVGIGLTVGLYCLFVGSLLSPLN